MPAPVLNLPIIDNPRESRFEVQVDGDPQARKMDVRLYTYAGVTILAAARLYQGQTTNFRTPGGGFAPVVTLAPPNRPSIEAAASLASI